MRSSRTAGGGVRPPRGDCAFLLDLVDGLRTAIAHTPTRATRVVHLLPPDTVLPVAPTIPPPREPAHWLGRPAGGV